MWFRRKKDSAGEYAAERVASELTEFLGQATETRALSQAIDSAVRAREQGETEFTDAPRGTDDSEEAR